MFFFSVQRRKLAKLEYASHFWKQSSRNIYPNIKAKWRVLILNPTSKKQMEFFNKNPELDKIQGIKQTIDEVHKIALDNIELLVKREGRLDDLIAESDELQHHSNEFVRGTEKLRFKMCRQNVKYTILMIVAFLIYLFVIFTILFLVIFIPIKVAQNRN